VPEGVLEKVPTPRDAVSGWLGPFGEECERADGGWDFAAIPSGDRVGSETRDVPVAKMITANASARRRAEELSP
jgi:hypothetical protein